MKRATTYEQKMILKSLMASYKLEDILTDLSSLCREMANQYQYVDDNFAPKHQNSELDNVMIACYDSIADTLEECLNEAETIDENE